MSREGKTVCEEGGERRLVLPFCHYGNCSKWQ